MKQRKEISVKGIVQGVGFRPFVYSLATKHSVNGFVINNPKGVVIEIEGEETSLEEFISDIKHRLPPLSRIEDMKLKSLPPIGYKEFSIKPSSSTGSKDVLVSSDIATCEECLHELFDKNNRRFSYVFINCTNCGPRFTIIKDIPYDRKRTTMKRFEMCSLCQHEYENPQNRRFHTQPNGCKECGPEMSLGRIENGEWKKDNTSEPIKKTALLLKQGKIIAVKGLGGFHLACDANNGKAVTELRSRKQRKEKPFAVMAKNIETIKSFCFVDEVEEKLLYSKRRPIVLLKRKEGDLCLIADEVASKQKYYGVMLPYTPLHHLILSEGCPPVLIMTSANAKNEPICYREEDAFIKLSKIADYFLIHNREIHTRCDDSVTRIFEGKEILLRRARGYVPEPIVLPIKNQRNILACGAELKSTFCLARDNYAFVSHHIGDLENLITIKSFEDGIEHFKKLFSIEPEVVTYDMHPEYLSTKYAKKISLHNPHLKMIPIQHHHAHIASCMVENGLSEKVIGIAFDGTGYGTDRAIWGGEFLIADFENFRREGHFNYIPMPGGEMAIKEPWRMAVSYLYHVYGDEFLNLGIRPVERLDKKKWIIIKRMLSEGINSPPTSSVGRLFDAVSAILSIRDNINYEGQAAIELEMAIEESRIKTHDEKYKYTIRKENELLLIDTKEIVIGIVEDLKHTLPIGLISFKFHTTIAEIIADMVMRIRKKFDLNKVALSGGVFQNIFLLQKTVKILRSKGFDVYVHHQVPTNDGGISLGQVAIASQLSNS